MKKLILAVVFMISSLIAMATSLTDGLVAYWPFDGNADDLSGNGNNGTIYGVTITSDRHGNTGKAMRFGVGNYIVVPSSSSLNSVSAEITIAAWIKVEDWHVTGQKWAALLSKGEDYGFNLSPESYESGYYGNNWCTSTQITGDKLADFSGVSFKGRWVHVAVTIGTDNVCRSYVNGKLHSRKSCPSGRFYASNSSLTIGQHPLGEVEWFFGIMDDLYIYNRVLSSSEIRSLCFSNPPENSYVVIYDASVDNVNGDMGEQVFNVGEKQKLRKNVFESEEGYIFQGWHDEEGNFYKDEAEITINADKTLYAIWASPTLTLTLTAESADWSVGSITLRCEDGDTSAATHEYTLEYKKSSDEWEEVEGAKNVAATKGQDANGQEVWVVKLTDNAFWSRLGGIPPVEYRVKDEKTNRFSEPCVTRTRHGIFVGVGKYGPSYPRLVELEQAPSDAKDMNDLVCGKEGFKDMHLLTNSGATYNAVSDAFAVVAENVKNKPGDVCILFFSTHGGVFDGNTTTGVLVLYDKPPVADDPKGEGYHEGLLARHIRSLDPQRKGVAVVCIISACHSGAFFDDSNEAAICEPLDSWCHKEDLGDNVAWITAADAKSSSVGLFDYFMRTYGWKLGWARKNCDLNEKSITFYDLGKYTIDIYKLIAKEMSLSGGEIRKDDVLKHIVAFVIEAEPNLKPSAPSAPINVTATKDLPDYVKVEWEQGLGEKPDGYIVVKRRKDSDEYEPYCWVGGDKTSTNIVDVASQQYPMLYKVVAYNGAGVAPSDKFVEGWRTIDLYRATFDYNFPVDWPHPPNLKMTPFMEANSSLKTELQAETEKLSEYSEPDSKPYKFNGWKENPTDILGVVLRNADGSWHYPDIYIKSDMTLYADWIAKRTNGMTQDWVNRHTKIAEASGGDIARAAAMTAANGCRTVGECYALGINPEDPDDDLKITSFEMKDGKPVIDVNHTEDGSGNSFKSRIKTLGKVKVEDPDWEKVPDEGYSDYQFFTIGVEMP